jgi:hypothetical protein
MHRSPSPDFTNPFVVARLAVLRGEHIPATTQARLEALGVDVPAMEQRLIEMNRFSS